MPKAEVLNSPFFGLPKSVDAMANVDHRPDGVLAAHQVDQFIEEGFVRTHNEHARLRALF